MTDFGDVVIFHGGVEVLTCLFVFFGFLGVVSLGCVVFFSTICSGGGRRGRFLSTLFD